MTRDRQRRTIQLLLVLVVLLGVALLAVGWKWQIVHQMATVEMAERARSMEQVRLGGPFTLVDHHGRTVSEADFEGRFLLMFFGYTSCPDVCPLTLQNISRALNLLGAEAGRLAPLFVSVDPARDTTQVIADYLSNFHPAIVGLTGGGEQLAAVTRAYGIFYEKIKTEENHGARESPEDHGGHKAPPADAGQEDYYLNHASMIFLMAPDGAYLTHFSLGTGPSEIAATIAEVLKNQG